MIEKVYAALDEKQEKSSDKIDAMFKDILLTTFLTTTESISF